MEAGALSSISATLGQSQPRGRSLRMQRVSNVSLRVLDMEQLWRLERQRQVSAQRFNSVAYATSFIPWGGHSLGVTAFGCKEERQSQGCRT